MTCVLHAEDDPNVSAVVRSYFAHYAPDWVMESAASGQACLDRMAQGGIDILILDLVMPDINGLQVLGELARRGDPTPVVMASGLGQTDLAVRALRAGAADCVDKTSPQFLQIVDIVKRVLARHREKPRVAAPPAAGERHAVLLVEVSALIRRTVEEFFAAHAPQFALASAANEEQFEGLLGQGGRIDAVLIGPTPGRLTPLDTLRHLHTRHPGVPAILLAARSDGETAVAAFKLGAQDYIIQKPDYLADVVFSLGHILRRADAERNNARLSRELETLNRSLEAQVQARTGELQALSMKLLRVQEDERRAIARDLHDQLGQLLTGLRFQLEAAHASAPPALQAALKESLGTSDEVLRHLRDMTQQLRPRVLDDLGLTPALEWHASQFLRQTGITATLDVSLPAARLPGELETTIFRLVQEALTNVARHSGAKAAAITLTQGNGRLIAEISDRGRGFDAEARLAARDSLGLTGLRERVTLAGGSLEIFSRIGQGTRLHAEFPLATLNPSNGLPP